MTKYENEQPWNDVCIRNNIPFCYPQKPSKYTRSFGTSARGVNLFLSHNFAFRLLSCFSSPFLFLFSLHFHNAVSLLTPATNIRRLWGDVNYPISGSLLIFCCDLSKSVRTWLQQQQEGELGMKVPSAQVPLPSLQGLSMHTRVLQDCKVLTYGNRHPLLPESKMWKKNSPLSLEINK